MARTVPLQDSFTTGMRRDYSRSQMPRGSAWNLVDWIPGLGAALRKRGGYSYASTNITLTNTNANHIVAGIYGEFAAGSTNLCLDEDGELYRINSASSTTDLGAAVVPAQNPVFHRDTVIIPAANGSSIPKKYDGATTIANLASDAPAGIYACTYKDRTVLGNSAANPERLWFSDPGDPTGWDTTNAWWDSSHPITGLAALRNAILIFSTGHTERLRGSTPPPGSDMIMDPLFEIGCTDAKSIALYGESCVFMNPLGIYRTDGAALVDLTAKCGVKSYWKDILAGYSQSSWTLAGGIFQGHYVFTVMNGTQFIDGGMVNIDSQVFFRASNLDAGCFWPVSAASQELYFGQRTRARVAATSPMFSPSVNQMDADGTSVLPVLETVYFTGDGSKSSFKNLYARYDIRDPGSTNPQLQFAYTTSPESQSYTTLGTMSETSEIGYARTAMRFSALGVAFKVTQTAASSDTRLHGLSVDAHSREMSRLG